MRFRGVFVSLVIALIFALIVLSGCSSSGGSNASNPLLTVVRAWHHPASLVDNISPNGQNAALPQVAMDNKGNIIIVWCQSDGAKYQIYKSEYRNDIWTHPASLADNISPEGQDVAYPRVAMDNKGNAIIVWYQSDGTNYQIFKSEYRNGAWTHPTSLADNISPDGQNAAYPQVAMDNNGNAIIVWYQSDGSRCQIFKSEYRNGGWTHPTSSADNISPDGQNAAYPQVAMDSNGNAIIVWYQYDGSKYQIFKSEYRGGTWHHPSIISDNISPDGQDAALPQVAMDSSGNAIIVWYQYDGANYQIFKSEYRGGAWYHPSSISDNISPDGQDAALPQVAMDNNGNAIIVWSQSNGTFSQIFKSEFRNGAWTHPLSLTDNVSSYGQKKAYNKQGVSIDLSNLSIQGIDLVVSSSGDTTSSTGQPAAYPHVAMDNSGNAIIVWYQFDGANGQIFKSEYRNGAWINPASLTDNISPDGQNAAYPQVAMDSSGNAIIVWNQLDGANGQIYKSEYR